MPYLQNLEQEIEEATNCLESALCDLDDDPDRVEEWPALRETAAKIRSALAVVQALLPLHPEIEAAAIAEANRDDQYESPRR